MKSAALSCLLLLATGLPAAAGQRTQVYSLEGIDSGEAGEQARQAIRKLKGVRKAEYDRRKAEIEARLEESVKDDQVVAALRAAGVTATVGAGHGRYQPEASYPEGADVARLTEDGSAVGPLDQLRASGKFTVFDVYADWCGPCRQVDAHLREILGERKDVAVRKLNVVDFDTPLARALGPGFQALPFVIVYSPAGKRTVIEGADLKHLDRALAR